MSEIDPSSAVSPPESLSEFPVVIALKVQWGDQDAFGHVNNTMYFRWCETARVVYLDRIGMWEGMASDNVGPILASIGCNFRRQVTFPDTVSVGARVTQVGNSSFRMEHRIVSHATKEVVAEADSTLVFFDYKRDKSVPLPEAIRQAIADLEEKARPS
jgi:acyl-CoA thioester hydrolase